jgi:hypothetical protein
MTAACVGVAFYGVISVHLLSATMAIQKTVSMFDLIYG